MSAARPTTRRRKARSSAGINRILLESDYMPGDLEAQIGDFVSHYNHRRYHESLGNLTPADVYSGRSQTILMKREAIKQRTFEQRRLQHAGRAA